MIRKINIGCHLSTSKGYKQAFKTAKNIGATTFQFFSRNPRGSSVKTLSDDIISTFRGLTSEYNMNAVAHLPYTVNAASPNDRVYDFSKKVILEDLNRMDALGVNYLVMHPGSFVKSSVDEGITKIIKALDYVYSSYAGDTILCLETMSGKGSEIGRNFNELNRIIESVSDSRLGVCLDTCHLFASGYNFKNKDEVVRLVSDIDNTVGFSRVYMSHLNDSQHAFNSNKDRHAKVGEGLIGIEGILNYITNPQIITLPLILETPVQDVKEHSDEIELLNKLVEEKGCLV